MLQVRKGYHMNIWPLTEDRQVENCQDQDGVRWPV